MAFAQYSIVACFAIPILFFAVLGVHAINRAIRAEMVREQAGANEADTANVAMVLTGLASFILTAFLIAGCIGLVRWVA